MPLGKVLHRFCAGSWERSSVGIAAGSQGRSSVDFAAGSWGTSSVRFATYSWGISSVGFATAGSSDSVVSLELPAERFSGNNFFSDMHCVISLIRCLAFSSKSPEPSNTSEHGISSPPWGKSSLLLLWPVTEQVILPPWHKSSKQMQESSVEHGQQCYSKRIEQQQRTDLLCFQIHVHSGESLLHMGSMMLHEH